MKQGDCRLFYDVTDDHAHVAVVGIGSCDPEKDCEDIDILAQNIRSAAAGQSLLTANNMIRVFTFTCLCSFAVICMGGYETLPAKLPQ